MTRRRSSRWTALLTLLAATALVAVGGVVLWGDPPQRRDDAGLLIAARDAQVRWQFNAQGMLLDDDQTGSVRVAATAGDLWLLQVTQGIGNSFQLIDARTGTARWPRPVDAGQGGCALGRGGVTGCAVDIPGDDAASGFRLIDTDGAVTARGELLDTRTIAADGEDFYRATGGGSEHVLSRTDRAGTVRWTRRFDADVVPEVRDGVLAVRVGDLGMQLLDPATGEDRYRCDDCSISVHPDGVVVHKRTAREVEFLDRNGDRRTRMPNSAPVDGVGVRPVLALDSPDVWQYTRGEYEGFDPATGRPLWNIGDDETSKSNSFVCGAYVAVAQKAGDGPGFKVHDVVTGRQVGTLPYQLAPSCVGSASGRIVVFDDSTQQLRGYDVSSGRLAFSAPATGAPREIGGRIVGIDGLGVTVYG